jgi:hypothetical protein
MPIWHATPFDILKPASDDMRDRNRFLFESKNRSFDLSPADYGRTVTIQSRRTK